DRREEHAPVAAVRREHGHARLLEQVSEVLGSETLPHSADRLLDEGADLRLLLRRQLLQCEGGGPHVPVVELRRLVEAERRVPGLELLGALKEADDLSVERIGRHAVPGSRRERRRRGLDDRVDPIGHGAIRLRQLGNLREDVLLARGGLELARALLHRGSLLGRESLLLCPRPEGQALLRATAARTKAWNAAP